MCRSIRDLLSLHGFHAQGRHHLTNALKTLERAVYDLVLLDIELNGHSGFVVMDRLREKSLDTRVIVIIGYSTEAHAITALKKGATDYLKKPFEPDVLIRSVKTVLQHQHHLRELQLFEQILSAIPESIVIADGQGSIVFHNRAYRKMISPLAIDPEPPAIRYPTNSNDIPRFDRQVQKVLETGASSWSGQVDMLDTAGHRFVVWKRVDPLPQSVGGKRYGVAIMHEMAARPKAEDLATSLEQIKNAFGMLSICAGCKKIRTKDGGWTDIEALIEAHTSIEFSHGICPECVQNLYPELRQE